MREHRRAGGASDEPFFRSRTHPGQITNVNARTGKIAITLIGSHESHEVDIPLTAFDIQGLSSSWQRAMPQVNSYVEVAFDVRNRVLALRPISWQFNADTGGYAEVAQLAVNDPLGFGTIFRPLEPGEFDLRSAGGAGYLFTRGGRASVFAGNTALDLDLPRNEATTTAGLWRVKGDAFDVRVGAVKRLLPGEFVERAVPTGPGAPIPREWSVRVGAATPPTGAPLLTYYSEVVGDVRDDRGAPIVGNLGSPVRARRTYYDATGLAEVARTDIDVLGNVHVRQAASAVRTHLEAPASTLHVEALAVDVSATTSVDLSGAFVRLNAGGTADSAIVRGNELALYFATKLSVLTAFGPSGPALIPLLPGVELSTSALVR